MVFLGKTVLLGMKIGTCSMGERLPGYEEKILK
jgi:hypothetical protein